MFALRAVFESHFLHFEYFHLFHDTFLAVNNNFLIFENALYLPNNENFAIFQLLTRHLYELRPFFEKIVRLHNVGETLKNRAIT